MTSSSLATARAMAVGIALAAAVSAAILLPAPAFGHAGHAALMGDDVFFRIGGEPFLVPLAAIRYPSVLHAPIFQFYFDAPIQGVAGPFVALDSVRCHYSSARADAVAAFEPAQLAAPSHPWQAGLGQDGFIVRDLQRGVKTVIRCSSDAAAQASHDAIAYCTHFATYEAPGHRAQLRLHYPRAYLGAWREIQAQVETQVQQFRYRGQQAMARAGAGGAP